MAEKKKWYTRWYMIVIYVFFGMAILGSFVPGDSTTQSQTYVCSDGSQVTDVSLCPTQTQQENNEISPATPTETTTPVETTTLGERNALDKALSYLRTMPFSYEGLVEQLEFEGYSHAEAVYGADNCGADWNEQAALKAQNYLDTMPFSRQDLIDQLEFEGFTAAQAEYGVEAVGY